VVFFFFSNQAKSSTNDIQILNSQAQVRGVRELEEVTNSDDGGLAGEEGLGEL